MIYHNKIEFLLFFGSPRHTFCKLDRMKNYITLLLIFCALSVSAQEADSITVNAADTADIYVINSTTRFVALPDEGNTKYSFFYRDLKYLKTIRELKFQSAEDANKFFDTCEKALETDKTFITHGYNVSRNRLSKNVLRLNNKEGGYYLLKYDSLEKMRKAFNKYTGKD